MEPQDFSPAYAQAIYKTNDLAFTLTDIPNDTVLFFNQSYAIITAHNPYSQKLSDLERIAPVEKPEALPEKLQTGGDMGADWQGGFYCPCHGSKFDLAGRVFKGSPAPINLVVPPHQYLTDATILIGVDKT